jgi:hypothetical protein
MWCQDVACAHLLNMGHGSVIAVTEQQHTPPDQALDQIQLCQDPQLPSNLSAEVLCWHFSDFVHLVRGLPWEVPSRIQTDRGEQLVAASKHLAVWDFKGVQEWAEKNNFLQALGDVFASAS